MKGGGCLTINPTASFSIPTFSPPSIDRFIFVDINARSPGRTSPFIAAATRPEVRGQGPPFLRLRLTSATAAAWREARKEKKNKGLTSPAWSGPMRLPRLPSAQLSRTFSSDFLLGGRKQSVGQISPFPAPVSLLIEVSHGGKDASEAPPAPPPPTCPTSPPPRPNLEASQGQEVEEKKKPGLSLSAQGQPGVSAAP